VLVVQQVYGAVGPVQQAVLSKTPVTVDLAERCIKCQQPQEPLSICRAELRLAAGDEQGWLRLQVEAGGEVDSSNGGGSGWAKARRVATAQVN
jgi:hypothetical protein